MVLLAIVLAGCKGEEGRGILELKMKRKKECCQMRIFSSFFSYLYFPSLNDIMSSAPLTPSLCTYTLLL